ncbi:MAG: alpha-glucosidase family protein [Bradymonadia bacterium]
MTADTDPQWWQGAVIYQVYPLSFKDSNGDGVGDLPGVLQQIAHIADLGVDALWLSPFYRSPLKDYGYDVADHTAVDPIFGTLEDFDQLLQAAHSRGLKVMIDLVLSHTSDQHGWFAESRSSRDNPKADWYVWADPRPDGTPPNNWQSEFGGSAWRWCPERQQYFFHNFLPEQPDLNFHNPEVQQAMLQVARFWLARGVDGFRLDALHCLFHDRRLRNNPPRPLDHPPPPEARFKPRLWQIDRYNAYRPQVVDYIRQLRSLCNTYGAVTLAEVGEAEGSGTSAEYIRGNRRLHMAYNFSLLGSQLDPDRIRSTLGAFGPGDWPCLSLGNHDVARPATRLAESLGSDGASAKVRAAQAVMLPALLSSVRAVSALYQGDELGLTQPHVPPTQMRDPYGLTFHPVVTGRDGARTPMPWVGSAPHGGFSTHRPWMPMADAHLKHAWDQQQHPESVLTRIQQFLHWRRRQPVLQTGDLTWLDAPAPLLAFDRALKDQRMRVVFNLSGKAKSWPVDDLTAWSTFEALKGHGLPGSFDASKGTLTLPPFGAWFGAC